MNFHQLETFQWVVTLGSFTKAAARLNTSQSTVSMRISDLEQELGVQLLDRTRRNIRMTPKGRELLRYAVEIDRLVTSLKVEVGNPETVSGSIRMGVAELVALTWLPEMASALKQHYPGIQLDLEVGLTGNIYDKFRSRETDLGFLPTAELPGQDLQSVLLKQVGFAFMVSPSIELPDRHLSPSDLQNLPLISLSPNSTLSMLEERWFSAHDAHPTQVTRSNSMEISAGLVRSGLGISLLPCEFYRNDITAGRMRPLDVRPSLRPVPFHAIWLDDNRSPLIREVVEIARRVSGSRAWQATQDFDRTGH